MSASDSPEPIGDGEYVVQQGECLASIAYDSGFLIETLWDDPGNASLKAGRKDPRMLLPGDRVHIPERRLRQETRATDSLHKFVRKGVPEMLRMVLLDEDGKPRSSVPYIILIDDVIVKSGKTDGKGVVEIPIAPNARRGELILNPTQDEERYQLGLGSLDPPSTITGAQARLNNLGFYCGDVDGKIGPLTAGAIREFQQRNNLKVTGELDSNTMATLEKTHGF